MTTIDNTNEKIYTYIYYRYNKKGEKRKLEHKVKYKKHKRKIDKILTHDQIKEIKEKHANGTTKFSLMNEYNISYNILNQSLEYRFDE